MEERFLKKEQEYKVDFQAYLESKFKNLTTEERLQLALWLDSVLADSILKNTKRGDL